MSTRILLHHLAVTGALVVAFCVLLLSGAAVRAQELPVSGTFVPNQIIVELEPEVAIEEINDINDSYNTRVKEPLLNEPNTRVFLLETEADLSVPNLEALVEQLLDDPRVVFAEPNFIAGTAEAAARHRAFPADGAEPTPERYSKPSYADTALNLSDAQQISKGEGTTVAVLDTGAQLDHPALKNNFEGVPRYDFVDDDTNPSEPRLARDKERRNQEMVGHGTHVAGVVDLVAPKAKIMPLRVLDRNGYGNVFDIAGAVLFAKRQGADVINLSLGTPSWSTLLRKTVEEATGARVVVVAAAGNSDSLQPQYPAARGRIIPAASDHDGLLAVTSVSPLEQKSTWANYGTWVDIAAPGEHILSAYPVSRYAYWDGTSMATPFVAGQATLIRAHDDSLDAAGVEGQIRCSARSLVVKDLQYGAMLGAGHTDVGASLEQPEPTTCTSS